MSSTNHEPMPEPAYSEDKIKLWIEIIHYLKALFAFSKQAHSVDLDMARKYRWKCVSPTISSKLDLALG